MASFKIGGVPNDKHSSQSAPLDSLPLGARCGPFESQARAARCCYGPTLKEKEAKEHRRVDGDVSVMVAALSVLS